MAETRRSKKQRCDGSGDDSSVACCPLAKDAKDFILHVISTDRNPEHLDYLSDRWLEDRDIAAAALKTNAIRASELPDALQKDRAYLLRAVQQNPEVWHSLPEPFCHDPEFVRGIGRFVDLLILHDMFVKLPDLTKDRQIWLHALDSALDPETGSDESKEIFRQLLEDFAPENIRSDKEIMRRASTFIKHIFSYFGVGLRDDKEFFQSIYGKPPNSSTAAAATSGVKRGAAGGKATAKNE